MATAELAKILSLVGQFKTCRHFTCIFFRNYGCRAVYPEAVDGCKALDLGSGAGLDCFVLSKLVGPRGHVTGIDMTKEQVCIIQKNL